MAEVILKETTLISIIIPVYNREGFIAETLSSILNQTYKFWECIIIDDGSTDRSLDIINSYVNSDSRYQVFKRNREPKGAPTCRNIGLEVAKSDFILFMDSDDVLMEYCLSSRLRAIDNYPGKDFYVFPISIEENIKSPTFQNVWLDRGNCFNDDLKAFFLWSQWQTMSVLWKKSCLEKLEGFDERLVSSQDGFLHRKALIEGCLYIVLRENKPDALYRISPDSITSNMTSEKIYSRYLSFMWNFLRLKELNKLDVLSKQLITGQFVYSLKELSKLQSEKYANEIRSFILGNILLNSVELSLLGFLFKVETAVFRNVIKKIMRIWMSKYILWKL